MVSLNVEGILKWNSPNVTRTILMPTLCPFYHLIGLVTDLMFPFLDTGPPGWMWDTIT